LLPHCEKFTASVILQRIRTRTKEFLSKAQARFRARKSTIDQLSTPRRLYKKYAKFGKYLYVYCIDFQKAFDSIWRAGLWHMIRFLGYSEKIVRVLQTLYENTMSAVRVDGRLTDWFETTVGVLRGCIQSPLLFNILLKIVMALCIMQRHGP